jgi:hypothetical protein
MRTPEFQLKKRIWEHYGPGRLVIYEGAGKQLRMTEEILPIGGVYIGRKIITAQSKSKKST